MITLVLSEDTPFFFLTAAALYSRVVSARIVFSYHDEPFFVSLQPAGEKTIRFFLSQLIGNAKDFELESKPAASHSLSLSSPFYYYLYDIVLREALFLKHSRDSALSAWSLYSVYLSSMEVFPSRRNAVFSFLSAIENVVFSVCLRRYTRAILEAKSGKQIKFKELFSKEDVRRAVELQTLQPLVRSFYDYLLAKDAELAAFVRFLSLKRAVRTTPFGVVLFVKELDAEFDELLLSLLLDRFPLIFSPSRTYISATRFPEEMLAALSAFAGLKLARKDKFFLLHGTAGREAEIISFIKYALCSPQFYWQKTRSLHCEGGKG